MQARKALGAALKRLRTHAQITQAVLGERAGRSTQYIAALEQGRTNPSLATLDALSRALGVTHAELFVPDDRSPKQGIAVELAELVAPLSPPQREHVLAIVREACALVRTPKRRR